MGAIAVARLVSAGLNPVLTPAGFTEGQWGADDRNERGQIIFCAGHDEFSDRYPWAPQANGVIGVRTLAVDRSRGGISAGGDFTMVNGQNRKRYAAFS